jgi:hypothetical protein
MWRSRMNGILVNYYYVAKDNPKKLVMVHSVNSETVTVFPIGARGMIVDIVTVYEIDFFNQKYRIYNP